MNDRKFERGVSLPETAIVMAVLLALMFGIMDFGRALYTYSTVAQLARQGARWAVVRGSNCTVYASACPAQSGSTDIQPYIRSISAGGMDANSINAQLNFTTPCSNNKTTNQAGCTASVTVSYRFNFLLPWMPSSSINMSSTSAMVIAN
jgi:Flp pilus assembly protein TadG